MISALKSHLRPIVNHSIPRRKWVEEQLKGLPNGFKLLDAGCGEQQYREYCEHLDYKGQDFGGYEQDEADSFAAFSTKWEYGKLDYVGDIWAIDEQDGVFDAVLCTEVLEHIPRAGETIVELGRLLRPGGKMILTVPSNSLRHQDPYYFVAGYSNHFLQYWLEEAGFTDINIAPQGDYYRWLMCEDIRSMRRDGVFAKLALLPAAVHRYFKQRNPTPQSVASLCLGYHVTATKA